ncbi:Exodeoxyribonuclease 7 small subunit [Jeotgalicoccus saudimassiliensis]|jgi:exodeoxyribonuclease VII small subunit|uniref:Exodeoxyribonuclease 7 small subunit n=1 Tax=Jeotgalicoccus saudimassiliensis TaxID=1461582 RepID=A0A078M469_9STAP|nr:exodeoxyribonuclease VII small subunit [Jeotgalicoccus saudimassiliensis]CEA00087.1 Exodeoxyribonuclease 7 small subunit [Jeotgalicoccus saudimassiliensis]
MTKNDQTFEMKMTRLETIVKSLDEEEVSLEKSLELYQEGIKLSQECDNILKNAELKVEELNKDTDSDGE